MERGTRTGNTVQSTLMILRIEVFQCLANDQAKLDFVMHIYAFGEQDGALSWQQQRRSRLEEEKGLFGFQAVEFGDMVSTLIVNRRQSVLELEESGVVGS